MATSWEAYRKKRKGDNDDIAPVKSTSTKSTSTKTTSNNTSSNKGSSWQSYSASRVAEKVAGPTKDIRTVKPSILDPAFVNTVSLASSEDTKNAKVYKPNKSPGEKAISSILGVGGNFLMGIEGTMPKTINYANELMEYATQKATGKAVEFILGKTDMDKETVKKASSVASSVLGKKVYKKASEITNSGIYESDKLLNSEAMNKWRSETIQKNTEKAKQGGVVGEFMNDVAIGVGQNVIPAILAFVPGGQLASGTLFMSSSAGSYLEDADARGMNDDQRIGYATAMGIFEGGFDYLLNGLNVNRVTKLLGAGEIFSKQALKSTGFSAIENALQEGLTEPTNELVADIVGGYGNWEDIGSRSLRSAAVGAVSGLFLDGANKGIASATYTINVQQNKNEAIKTAEQQLGRQLTTEETNQITKQVQDYVKSQMIDTEDLSNEERAEIENLSNMTIDDMVESALTGIVKSGKVDTNAILNGVSEAIREKDTAQAEGLQQAIEEKQEELSQTQDIREQQIIQDEINVLQEELNEATNAQNFTNEQQTEVNAEIENITKKTKENISKAQNSELVEMVSIDDINTIDRTGGGYRTEEQITQLREDIKNNGITQPIEVIKDENGDISLNDGNHRLQIAKELGLKEIPVIAYSEGKFTKYTDIKNNVEQAEAVQDIQSTTDEDSLVIEQDTNSNQQVMTEEEYLASKGYGSMGYSEPGLHKSSARISQNVRDKQANQVMQKAEEYDAKREELRQEYQAKLESGEIRQPTKIESLLKTAQGHEDNKSVQAARRLLEKRGIDWQTGEEISKTKGPSQKEIDNLLDIQKNKSGSEYALAFNDLKKKYGEVELYKALNNEYSRQKTGQDKVVEQVEEVIAPLQEKIENLTEQLDTVVNSLEQIQAPTSQDIVEKQGQEAFDTITDKEAPSFEDTVDDLMWNEEFESTSTENITSPFDTRDIDEVGNRKVNAYQYENPEVRPYFQEEAQNMMWDLNNTIKGERSFNDQLYYDSNGEQGFFGTTRQTTEAIAYLKDKYGYSYAQIEKGLNDIIEDNGKENNAVAKRIEFMLDERLREGYTTSDGIPIPPNEEYIKFLEEKQITEYNREISSQLTDIDAPIEEIELEAIKITDNQGREVSREIQEELKDSKVRDKEGNLLTVYHGTDSDFNEYTTIKTEPGYWFTESKEYASEHGKNIKEQYLNITNPIDDVDKMWDIAKDYFGNDVEEKQIFSNKFKEHLKNLGYDGMVWEHSGSNTYVAFDSNQIKNINNTNPIEEIAPIKEAPVEEAPIEEAPVEVSPEPSELPVIDENAKGQLSVPLPETTAQNRNTELTDTSTETQEQEKVAQILSERPTQENKKQRIWAKARAAFIDKGSVFEDLSLKTKNRELMAKWNDTLSSEAVAQDVLLNGTKEIDALSNTNKQVSKSLYDIRTEVGDKVQEFSEYLYHKHNVDRMSIESNAQARMAELQETVLKGYDLEAIEALSRKRIPNNADKVSEQLQFKDVAKQAEVEINAAKEFMRLTEAKNKPVFGNSVTAEISQQKVDEFEMNNPEFMDWANDVYDFNNANLSQLIKGGVISQETADQFAEIYPHYVPIGRANVKGNAINVPLDTNRTGVNAPIARATGGNSDILPLFDTMEKRTLQTYRAIAKNDFGVELKNTLNSTIENQQSNVDEILDNVDQQESLLQEGKNGKAPTFTVFENGEKVTYEITEDMYDALKPVSEGLKGNILWGIPNKISNIHRGVLTEYNPVFMLTNSIKDSQDILLNSQHATKTYSKMPEAYAQILKKGLWYQEYMASGGQQNSYFDTQEDTIQTERKGISKVLDLPPLKQISQLNNIIELAPRLAEYIASRESGRSKKVSMLDAARVTTNFKAGGDITKWANRNGATFLNASIQGAMQQVRNVREAHANGLKGYANLVAKFALAGVPAMILNGLLWGDDEEYEELSDYVKQNYWIVGKYGDGNFIRIPKGRMITVVQEGLNQMKNLATGDDEADLGQFLEILGNNIAPNNPIENNVLSPIIQAVTNKTWYGGDLVPTRLQDVPTEEQYDESIDKLSIAIGQATGISPYKINYVLDQYSGGVGDVLLPMMTQQAEGGKDDLVSNLLAPLTNKFTVDSTMKNQSVTDLYELSDELTVKANSSKATDEDILKDKYLNSVKSEMNELYKEKREIQNSNLPDSQKYNQVREIQDQINTMAKEATTNYENVTKKNNYATVGNKEYYLKNDTWTKVNDDELADLNNLGMSITDKGNYFNLKTEINKIKDSSTENKRAAIATTIRDTNFTDEQKAFVYGKNYSNDETLDMVLNTGMSFNEYLNYASQEFVADKNSEGKSISGSRKTKVISYINSLNLNIPQKAMLIRKEYSTFNDYNEDIIRYVDGLDLTYDKKKSILESVDMKVSADGTISWK